MQLYGHLIETRISVIHSFPTSHPPDARLTVISPSQIQLKLNNPTAAQLLNNQFIHFLKLIITIIILIKFGTICHSSSVCSGITTHVKTYRLLRLLSSMLLLVKRKQVKLSNNRRPQKQFLLGITINYSSQCQSSASARLGDWSSDCEREAKVRDLDTTKQSQYRTVTTKTPDSHPESVATLHTDSVQLQQ